MTFLTGFYWFPFKFFLSAFQKFQTLEKLESYS